MKSTISSTLLCGKLHYKNMSLSIPNEFKDPISGDWMKNPVCTPCGHIFDKMSLLNWLRTQRTCPNDRVRIREEDLVEQQELKEKIESYMTEHPEILQAIKEEETEWFEKEEYARQLTRGNPLLKGIKILAPIVIGSTGTLFGIANYLSIKFAPSYILPISASISLPWFLTPCLHPNYIVIISGVSTAYTVLCLTGDSCFAGLFGSSVHFAGKIAIHIGKKIREGNLGPAALELREAVRYMFP